MDTDTRQKLERIYQQRPPIGLIINVFLSTCIATTLTVIAIRHYQQNSSEQVLYMTFPACRKPDNYGESTRADHDR
jgi:hypothetical protein